MSAPAATEQGLTLGELREAAELAERQAVAAKVVDEAALDERRPGGPEYPDVSARAWLNYHGWLMGRILGAGASGPDVRTLEQVKFDAAGDVPYPVALGDGRVVMCQPKSWYALQYMRALDEGVRAIGPEVAAVLVGEAPVSEAVHAAVLGRLLEGRMLGVWLWCAVDGGVGLPFAEDAIDPEPPAWIKDLRWADVVEIWRGHAVPNKADLQILARAFPGRDDPSAPKLGMEDMMASLAHEWGMQASVLTRTWSLRGLYHAALVAAWNARRAREKPTAA